MELPQHWPLADADGLRDELIAAYDAPGRDFHDTHHLRAVLDRLVVLASNGTPFAPLPVTLAAWFHDSRYDGERDSEERAAAWAREALAPHLSPEGLDEVARLVLLTETHVAEPDDLNGAALSDADLGVLAGTTEEYADYLACVRREFGYLEDEQFHTGRTHLIEKLLHRPAIFQTAHAHTHWEAPARTNLAEELASMGVRQ
jgi:predicted metal-dependent HD superfamily phosphohydrolase